MARPALLDRAHVPPELPIRCQSEVRGLLSAASAPDDGRVEALAKQALVLAVKQLRCGANLLLIHVVGTKRQMSRGERESLTS